MEDPLEAALLDMIILGHVEVAGLNENDETTYRLTEEGERWVEEEIGLVGKH